MVSKAIQEGDRQAVQYFVAQKYVDSLKDIAASRNSKLVIMPMESASLVGSVAGVAELLKGFAPKPDGDAPETITAQRPRLVD